MSSIVISFIFIAIVNILAYLWAYKKQSDHLTDISYSLCFIVVTLYFLLVYGGLTQGRVVLALMLVLWGIRLGGFLFYRIQKMGKDARFDTFRGSAAGFLKFWILQAVSISIIILPVLFGLEAADLQIHNVAFALWLTGWIIQAAADWQKFSFRQTHSAHEFIDYGLYKYIRHPNYLGEILIWGAIFWYVTPVLAGWHWLAVVSPLWIIFLLVKVSGIPLIEETYPVKYKDNPLFQKYLKRSYRLIPFIYWVGLFGVHFSGLFAGKMPYSIGVKYLWDVT